MVMTNNKRIVGLVKIVSIEVPQSQVTEFSLLLQYYDEITLQLQFSKGNSSAEN